MNALGAPGGCLVVTKQAPRGITASTIGVYIHSSCSFSPGNCLQLLVTHLQAQEDSRAQIFARALHGHPIALQPARTICLEDERIDPDLGCRQHHAAAATHGGCVIQLQSFCDGRRLVVLLLQLRLGHILLQQVGLNVLQVCPMSAQPPLKDSQTS